MKTSRLLVLAGAVLALGSGALAQDPPPPRRSGHPTLVVRFERSADQVEAVIQGRAPSTTAAWRVPLLMGSPPGLQVRSSGRPVWAVHSPDPEMSSKGVVELLAAPGPEAEFHLRFPLAVRPLATGVGARLELGPARPARVEVGDGLEVVGTLGPSRHVAGHGRVAVGWTESSDPEALDHLREELEDWISPAQPMRIDVHYRVRPGSVQAQVRVLDQDPEPGSTLELVAREDARILSCQDARSGRPVPFRQAGERVLLEPGPGPGPRSFLIAMAGISPTTPGEEFSLPMLAPGADRPQRPGIVAFDQAEPGADGAPGGALGAARVDSAADSDPELAEAWGRSGYTSFEYPGGTVTMVLSSRAPRQRSLPLSVDADTVLSSDATDLSITDVGLSLPQGARWKDVVAWLPEGARDVRVASEGTRRAVIWESGHGPGSGRAPAVRLRVTDGPSVHLVYSHALQANADGRQSLRLPSFQAKVASLQWAVRATPGWVLGVPASPTSTAASLDAPGDGASSAGPSALGLSGSLAEAAVAGPAPPSSTGEVARVTREDLAALEVVEVEVALVPRRRLHNGLAVVFLAGVLAGLWVAAGAATDARLALVVVAGLLLVFGLGGFQLLEVESGWGEALVGGLVFAGLLRAFAWGLRPTTPPPGSSPRDARSKEDPPRDRPQAAAEGP